MEEKDLVDLGFERKDITAEESGNPEDWYYYTYDFGNGCISLITPSNDEVKDGEWSAEIFEDETIRFTDAQDLKIFKEIIERNIQ
jgi:hypothetical protein